MKMFKTAVTAGALAVASLVPAFAQSETMRVNVPFSFYVGAEKMGAGQYDVQTETANGLVLIQGEGRGVAVVTSPFSETTPDGKASLIFENTEAGPQLIRVQLDGEPSRRLPTHNQVRVKFATNR